MNDDKALDHNPLDESERILTEDFYGRISDTPASKKKAEKPKHYKIICISMYTKDIEQLEQKVADLKAKGYSRANKSQLIRMALRRLDVEDIDIPKL